MTKKEREDESENSKKTRMEWEREREAMREEISELRDNMRQNYETLKKMEGKHKVQTGHASGFVGVTIFIFCSKCHISRITNYRCLILEKIHTCGKGIYNIFSSLLLQH